MSLPDNVQTGTVIGRFLSSKGGAPITGTVSFTPSFTKALDGTATPPTTLLPEKVVATLVDGAFSVELVATNDPDLGLGPWTYKVDFAFGNTFKVPSFPIEVPQGTTTDLTLVAPAGQAGGALLVQGIPTGGAAGYILGKNSPADYDTVWIPAPSGGTGLPAGGTSGQALVKQSSTAGDATWQNLAPGLIAGLSEAIDDRVAALLVAGTNVSLTYDDASGTLTIASSGGGGGGAVTSVNLQTGAVVLDAADVGALPDTYEPSWDDVTAKPAVIAAGATAEIARTAIGAGTSSLALGTTGATAMAGNKTAADLGGVTGTGITAIEKITQAAYDALDPKVATTLYWIV